MSLRSRLLVSMRCRLSQEAMRKEVALLQRQLEAKERRMLELTAGSGSVPALKQHYDRWGSQSTAC